MPQNPVPSTLFVTKIIAGAGISINPVGGTGIITITATEGDPSNVAITGGHINGTTIGDTAPAPGTFNGLTNRGQGITHQGAPTAATVSATLAAAALLSGIITVNQGGAAASAQQLPLAADLDVALPASIAGDAFDFSVINVSTVAAEAASLTTNTGWTLVGDADIAANSAITTKSAGRFRARKTAAGAWTLYRLS